MRNQKSLTGLHHSPIRAAAIARHYLKVSHSHIARHYLMFDFSLYSADVTNRFLRNTYAIIYVAPL
jgi:hypothetical protein